MNKVIDFILNVDKYLEILIGKFGVLTYFILFLIILLETGLVVTPFLPGDSLLFVAGTFASGGAFNIWILFILLSVAAILGDSLNYAIGSYFGVRVFEKSRFFKKEYLDKTKGFYDKYGKKTIVMARFVPIIRTFAPFVAGVGKMRYSSFISYNIVGGILWVALFLFGGYFFGQVPFVEKNLTLVIFAIIFISILPPVIEYLRHRLKEGKKRVLAEKTND